MSDPDRARALTAIATEFAVNDSNRAWDILGDTVRAANAADKYDPDNVCINARLWTAEGAKTRVVNAEQFGPGPVLRLLSKTEFERSIELGRSFKNENARAAAILMIADVGLEPPARSAQSR